MNVLTPSVTTAILLSLSATGIAETAPIQGMEKIVVSGTKTPKLLSDSPVAVDVIEGDTISLITKGTVADALDYIPGVIITRSPKEGYNIMMNGFDSKHVLILLDGQPLISPTGSSVDLDQINANNILQIEVLRGASSVMYGSSAMGGVINIITDPDSGNSVTYEIGSYIDDSVDDDNSSPYSHLFNLNLQHSAFGWRNRVDVKHTKTAAFDYEDQSVAQNAADLEKTFVTLSSAHQGEVYNTRVKYQYFDEAKSRILGRIPGQSTFNYYRSDVEQHQFDASLNNDANNWKLNARHMSHEETSGQSSGLRNADITLSFVDGLKVFQFGDSKPAGEQYGIEATIGFEANNETLNQTKADGTIEVDDKSRDNLSAYGQLNWIKQDYQILAGLRAQDDSNFGFASALSVSAMFNVGAGSNADKLRIGFGQGYRVPDLKERFYYFDHSNLGYKVIGNADLQQEEADNFTLSYDTRGHLGEVDFALTLSGHYSETKDEIATVTDADLSAQENLTISVYTNIAETVKHGGDFSAEFNYHSWTAQFNYSYLDAKDGEGERLFDRPRHQIKSNFGYTFEGPQVEVMAYLVYQADQAYDDSFVGEENNAYTLVNFKLQQVVTDAFSWHLSLDNAFNEHQSPSAVSRKLFDPRPVSSREIRLGATYQF